MGVAKDKQRIVITVSKELNDRLKAQAEKENRSVANLMNTIAIKYLEEQEER